MPYSLSNNTINSIESIESKPNSSPKRGVSSLISSGVISNKFKYLII